MNPFLADLYGTAASIGSTDTEQEKLAQASILEKQASILDEMFVSEGINVDDLAPETIEKVAFSLFGDENMIKVAEEDEEEEKKEKKKEKKKDEEEAQEKVAEADYLGRVMAHSYINEMTAIEKQAAGYGEAEKAEHQRISRGVGRALGGVYGTVGAAGMGSAAARTGGSLKARIAKGVGGALVGGALSGGLGYGAGYGGSRLANRIGRAIGGEGKNKEKQSSALDALAEQRAMEMIQDANQSGEEKLAGAVEQRAFEILAENGYTVE